MAQKRIQNIIAESRWSLTIMSVCAIAVWSAVALTNIYVLPSLLCMLFSTFLMMELNNTNALIRIYSRMVSCCYMAFTTMATFQFISYRAAIIVLCIVGFYTCIFRCYQDFHSPGWTFYAFLCFGLSSIVWVQTFYFLPILWILMATNLLAPSAKNYVSSFFGILLPNIVAIGVKLYLGDLQSIIDHFGNLIVFEKFFDYGILSIGEIVTALWVILCAIIGTTHFIRQKRSDSIRNRMLYGMFITINSAAIISLFLQPQHYDALLGIMIASTSPLLAHFIALTHTKLTNFVFKLLLLGTIVIMVFNLINSLNFLR